jgi:hypothetical protein
MVDISMPRYIKKKLLEYEHIMPKWVQTCPYSSEPKIFGTKAQVPLPRDASPKLDTKSIKHVQKIMGSILYYACAVDMTVLKALNSTAVEQTKQWHAANNYLITSPKMQMQNSYSMHQTWY